MITLKPEFEMQYNVANISNAKNELQSNIFQSMKENTNLKSELKTERNVFVVFLHVVFFVLYLFVLYFSCYIFPCCIFRVELYKINLCYKN